MFDLPAGSSSRSPATQSEFDWLRAALMDYASALEPIFSTTNGFECVIRGGELHLDLWPIRDFRFLGDDQLQIGTDTYGSDLVIDTSVSPPMVRLQCSFGGGVSQSLCPVTEFPEWITH